MRREIGGRGREVKEGQIIAYKVRREIGGQREGGKGGADYSV